MRVFSLATLAAALLCGSSAAVAGPGTLSQEGTQPSTYAGDSSPGTILLVRPLTDPASPNRVTGSAIFSVRDNGFGLRQLTPFADDVYNLPDAWFQPFDSLESWVGNAFSPSGRYSQFLKAHTREATVNHPFASGKYFIMNAWGQRTPPLFPGGNDLQLPKDGPSYGWLTWGPAGTDLIAYSNSVNGTPRRNACVRLMHPDGHGKRTLWCAPSSYPNKQAIEGLRWSGNGRFLLAYVEVTAPDNPNQTIDTRLFRINLNVGSAQLVHNDVTSPLHGAAADLSYDGDKVVFQTNSPGACAPQEQDQHVLCVRTLSTGQLVPLVDLDRTLVLSGGQLLLTPDGSHAVVNGGSRISNAIELYVIKTDGTQLRRLTVPCRPLDPNSGNIGVYWHPVRLSPDGRRVLANCYSEQGSPRIRYPTQIYVVDIKTASARYVIDGYAYDWHVPAI